MIFQDPYASLNPRMTVFDALAEAIQTHKNVAPAEMPVRVSELMKKVGLSPRYLKNIRTNSPAASVSALLSPARWRWNRN